MQWKAPHIVSGMLGEELVLDSTDGARPRGYAPWSPQTKTFKLLLEVSAVLAEYAEFGPLTARQVYYRLVGRNTLAKTEQEYARLCEVLSRARRSGHLAFDAIRDDGVSRLDAWGYVSEFDFVEETARRAESFTLDRQRRQPVRMWVLCEAAGMAPMLAGPANKRGVPVLSSGGFDSLTAKRELALLLARHRQSVVLHVGDHDPSGVHLFRALAEDVCLMVWQDARRVPEFVRLAVTEDQISEWDLPSAPPKSSDRRKFDGDAVQAEAIPPDVLVALVRDAIAARQDPDVMAETLAEEELIRASLRERYAP